MSVLSLSLSRLFLGGRLDWRWRRGEPVTQLAAASWLARAHAAATRGCASPWRPRRARLSREQSRGGGGEALFRDAGGEVRASKGWESHGGSPESDHAPKTCAPHSTFSACCTGLVGVWPGAGRGLLPGEGRGGRQMQANHI